MGLRRKPPRPGRNGARRRRRLRGTFGGLEERSRGARQELRTWLGCQPSGQWEGRKGCEETRYHQRSTATETRGNRRRRVGAEPEITVSGADHEPGPEHSHKQDHDDPVHSVLSVASLSRYHGPPRLSISTTIWVSSRVTRAVIDPHGTTSPPSPGELVCKRPVEQVRPLAGLRSQEVEPRAAMARGVPWAEPGSDPGLGPARGYLKRITGIVIMEVNDEKIESIAFGHRLVRESRLLADQADAAPGDRLTISLPHIADYQIAVINLVGRGCGSRKEQRRQHGNCDQAGERRHLALRGLTAGLPRGNAQSDTPATAGG